MASATTIPKFGSIQHKNFDSVQGAPKKTHFYKSGHKFCTQLFKK